MENPESVTKENLNLNGHKKPEFDIFVFLEEKLEEYRERMKVIIEKGGDIDNDDNYLDAKYKLFIGNAICHKKGANYGEIIESLVNQDGFIKRELFDNSWHIIKAYVDGDSHQLDTVKYE